MNPKTVKLRTLRMMIATAKSIEKLDEKQKEVLYRYVNGYSPLDIAITMNERARDIRLVITQISAKLGVDRGGLRPNIYAMGFADVALYGWDVYSRQVHAELEEELEARVARQSGKR